MYLSAKDECKSFFVITKQFAQQID